MNISGNKAVSSVTSHFSRFISSTLHKSAQIPDKPELIPAQQDQSLTFQPNESSCIESYFRFNNDTEAQSPASPTHVDMHSSWAGILFVTQGKLNQSSEEEHVVDPPAISCDQSTTETKRKLLLRCVSAGNFYERNHLKGRPCKVAAKLAGLPEILVSSSSSSDNPNQNDTNHCDGPLSKHLSHSTESFEPTCAANLTDDLVNQCQRASSENNLTNVSKSFNSFNYFQNAFKLASPTQISGNSFASLAKGVQSFAADFDPRKMLDASPKTDVSQLKTMKAHSRLNSSATKIIHL